ncbi:hypothetical protein HCH_01040 [Hahella chejuensis KCTC 2396]|uniref:Uncharacterized protein n=1 Tax=Hahella chejuensis (strain KCTC 2396) TaxID=349521 RepID=Q2SN52_HAHCH|nr:hypothetical protein HCH_01040 [Hahella chejuensis KCTC 2396]
MVEEIVAAATAEAIKVFFISSSFCVLNQLLSKIDG